MEEKRKPVKLLKANLTLNNVYNPTPQKESLIKSSRKILSFLKASQRQDITKHEISAVFEYIPGNVLTTLLSELEKDGLINNGGDYLLYLNNGKSSVRTVVFYLTVKGEKEIKSRWKWLEKITWIIVGAVTVILINLLSQLIKGIPIFHK